MRTWICKVDLFIITLGSQSRVRVLRPVALWSGEDASSTSTASQPRGLECDCGWSSRCADSGENKGDVRILLFKTVPSSYSYQLHGESVLDFRGFFTNGACSLLEMRLPTPSPDSPLPAGQLGLAVRRCPVTGPLWRPY